MRHENNEESNEDSIRQGVSVVLMYISMVMRRGSHDILGAFFEDMNCEIPYVLQNLEQTAALGELGFCD